ncbi:solute carrier family 25 member 38 [Mycena floridula]|nr:solute carrier family 25 member 38 [Mycena floridula]
MSNVRQQLISGASSGLASTVCLQPFDLLKTRLQQGDGISRNRNTTLLFQTTKGIITSNGILGLWRGTSASLMRNVPGVALYMTLLTQMRTIMATSPYFSVVRKTADDGSSVLPKLSNSGNLLAGATTRVAVGFALNPFTVLKARFESNMYAYESLFGAFASMARLGPSELTRGFLASALRDAPYAGLFVVLYEGIKRETSAILVPANLNNSASNGQSALIHSFSAASAGALATGMTHPFDVIKTKIQVRSEARYQGFSKTVKTIWVQRGVSGYFDGLSLRMSRKVLSSAIGWAVYEGGLRIFMRTSNQNDI